jgi:peptidoglycan/xylan/chitin deacetylase (PgdA/CDA1 family)
MYHSVSPASQTPNILNVTPERFEAQLRFLKQKNLRGVSVRELRQAKNTDGVRGLVGLTFDDGYANFLHEAVPVLERFGFTATLFVVAGMLGGRNDWPHRYYPRPQMKLLDAKDIQEISERGIEVGSHTMSHRWLPGLEPEKLQEEVSVSRQVLSNILGKEVNGFCYPYGGIDRASIDAVRRAQYTYACAVHRRVDHDSFDIPRMTMGADSIFKLTVKMIVYPEYVMAKNILRRQ